MIPESFKQDLLNRIDIVEVVSRYVQLKKAGANHSGLCPFHNEKTPSFSVSAAKQFYHCFGCGAHGNAIGFLMAYGGMGYVDAVKDLASAAGMQMPEWQPRTPEESARKERETDLYAVMGKAMDFYRVELKRSPRAIDYLKKRGLTGDIAARFGIGYAPDDWTALKSAFPEYADKSLVECGLVIDGEGKRYDRFRDRVMFPIFSARGAVIGFGGRVMGDGEPKYLNSPETPLFEKGREVYGLVQARDAIRTAGRVLVVEGYMDVVALAQYGVAYAVATLGTATTPVHVSRLLRLADEIVFCFDGDAAGRKAAWRALEVSLEWALDHKPVRFLFLPDGEDPDTYVRTRGKDAFEALVREAQTLSTFLIGELRSRFDLANAEGRSAFLSAAKPHLQKIAAPALRLQVIKAVAELAQVTQDEAESLLGLKSAKPAFRNAAPGRMASAPVGSLELHMLRCVIVRPALATAIDVALLDDRQPETAALRRIVDWVEADGVASGGMLIERFQGTEEAGLVFREQAIIDAQAMPIESAESEFEKVQIQLRIRRGHEEINALKAETGSAPSRDQLALLDRKTKDLAKLKSMLS